MGCSLSRSARAIEDGKQARDVGRESESYLKIARGQAGRRLRTERRQSIRVACLPFVARVRRAGGRGRTASRQLLLVSVARAGLRYCHVTGTMSHQELTWRLQWNAPNPAFSHSSLARSLAPLLSIVTPPVNPKCRGSDWLNSLLLSESAAHLERLVPCSGHAQEPSSVPDACVLSLSLARSAAAIDRGADTGRTVSQRPRPDRDSGLQSRAGKDPRRVAEGQSALRGPRAGP